MKAIDELKAEDVKRVYSGKPGCGCGCRGTYYKDEKQIKRIVNKMKLVARKRTGVHVGVEKDIAFTETESWNYWAYLKG